MNDSTTLRKLDVSGSGQHNGANVQTYNPNDPSAQRSWITETGPDTVIVMSVCSGKAWTSSASAATTARTFTFTTCTAGPPSNSTWPATTCPNRTRRRSVLHTPTSSPVCGVPCCSGQLPQVSAQLTTGFAAMTGSGHGTDGAVDGALYPA
ncbi:RICIN domain-containing protein [Streptomyces sp. NBC_01304]|uniref:RICIN domain-containing protein n=1 Tax=Streptomyces sp. NBC_01304 TaxID=2903818 RepID=UPI003FA3CCFB